MTTNTKAAFWEARRCQLYAELEAQGKMLDEQRSLLRRQGVTLDEKDEIIFEMKERERRECFPAGKKPKQDFSYSK